METEKILEMIKKLTAPKKVRRQKTSTLYRRALPGMKGRKAVKWLQDGRVLAALRRNESPLHRVKFMNRNDREMAALAMTP